LGGTALPTGGLPLGGTGAGMIFMLLFLLYQS
jgi:hypothetical protein